MNRYFNYILLGTFLTVALVIVFIQFNSNRSISQLITGNEDLLDELTVKTNLQQLQTGIVTLESKVRGTVIKGAAVNNNHLQVEIESIELSLVQTDTLQAYPMIAPLIVQLNKLVYAKIQFNKNVLDTFSQKGKAAAEQMINAQYGRQLADSIRTTAGQIEELHQLAVTDLIKKADSNGRKAKVLGTIMALMAAVVSVFTFGYVSYKVRQQQQLIARLNATEKQVREAAKVKENFMANMSHEIRTPMNAILGFTNLLQRKELDAESKEYVQTISKSGENLLTIINDILDLSKIEAGMMRIESAPFNIRGLVHSVETMFRAKAAEKGLQLLSSTDESLPGFLDGDAFRLTQILINLVGNALKFTEKGTISINITNEGEEGNVIKTGIHVSDTGIGINSNQLKTIFERFQQAENTVTRKYGGTGLGLSIVHELVLLQNGTIQVKSEPGRGTDFSIIIPYKISAGESRLSPTGEKKYAAHSGLGDACVLVAEDNEINQSLIRHLFKNWNLSFDLAVNGREAVEMLQTKTYQLILMDIQMPEMDGYTATEEIRQRLKLTTPIIAMTAHALAGEKEKCIGYGMNEYISKPVREDQLYALITRFIKISKKEAEGNSVAAASLPAGYKLINLQYMKEVSGGNAAYEKTVTEQFMEVLPEDLDAIEKAWHQHDITRVRQLAHNMKTTISVMGLNELLQPYLDLFEYEELNEQVFTDKFSALKSVCEASLKEASQFYTSL